MSVYNGAVRSITPSTTDDNWGLVGGAAKSCRVLAAHVSGEATTSTAMHTRHARSSGQNGNTTTGNVEKAHPNSPANGVIFETTFATTQPTLESGDLLTFSWNAHGGIMYWHAGAPDEEWVLIGAATNLNISSRNTVGTATSSYGVTWRED
jgi:hypothetical protein